MTLADLIQSGGRAEGTFVIVGGKRKSVVWMRDPDNAIVLGENCCFDPRQLHVAEGAELDDGSTEHLDVVMEPDAVLVLPDGTEVTNDPR